MKRDISNLRSLTKIILDKDLSELRRVAEQIQALLDQITLLRQHVKYGYEAHTLEGAENLAQKARAYEGWIEWCDQQIKTKNAKLARLRVRHEILLEAAKKSFGRDEALRQIEDRDQKKMSRMRRPA